MKSKKAKPDNIMLQRHINTLKQGTRFIRNGAQNNVDSQLLTVNGLVAKNRITSAKVRVYERREQYPDNNICERNQSLGSQRELTDEYEYQHPRSSKLDVGKNTEEDAQVLTAVKDPLGEEKCGILYFPN